MNYDDPDFADTMTLDEAERRARAARKSRPPESPDLTAAVERLAKLSRLEYERCRQDEAARLGMRVGTLDAEVATARGGTGSGRLQGRALELATPEPATEPVDGAALLDALAAAASHHVALPEHADTIISLWAVHTHAVEASSITPRLTITSPTMRCGKSTLLRLLAMVVRKPLPAENVTPAALFRTIEKAQPTLLIDEADSFLSRSDDLRGLLNSGHWRGSQFLRTVGDDHDPRVFATFAPVAIASIGKLPGTIQDRSVIISMRRRRPDEKIKRLRIDRSDDLQLLGRQAARWAEDNEVALAAADPVMPEGLGDRAADNWRPLLAIADLAGGDWPARARDAALALSGGDSDEGEVAGVMLLADLRGILDGWPTDRIASTDLVKHLVGLEHRPWGEWGKARRPITPHGAARLLAPFGIKPTLRREGANVFRGYLKHHFDDAFSRYPLSEPLQRYNPQEIAKNHDFQTVTSGPDVTAVKTPRAAESATCNGVTDEKGGSEGEIDEWAE